MAGSGNASLLLAPQRRSAIRTGKYRTQLARRVPLVRKGLQALRVPLAPRVLLVRRVPKDYRVWKVRKVLRDLRVSANVLGECNQCKESSPLLGLKTILGSETLQRRHAHCCREFLEMNGTKAAFTRRSVFRPGRSHRSDHPWVTSPPKQSRQRLLRGCAWLRGLPCRCGPNPDRRC